VAEVFRQAILENAPAIILAHNHPSGDPSPSPVIWRKSQGFGWKLVIEHLHSSRNLHQTNRFWRAIVFPPATLSRAGK